MVNQDIYALAELVGEKLSERKLKLVAVESCTGGLLAGAITAVAGSSAYFERGFVTYSNTAKIDMVGVDPLVLQQHGAVSVATAVAMVDGGLRNSCAQVGVAITGIAGPDGGSAAKPVGTVFFAWQILGQPVITERKIFVGTRAEVRWQAVAHALRGVAIALDF